MTEFSFRPIEPYLWTGRYSRIPGDTTAFHVRWRGSQWWPVVDWRISDEQADCPMAASASATALARAVISVKRSFGGTAGGSFLINEHGQVLVPSPLGTGEVALVGECSGSLLFHNSFDGGALFDLVDDQGLSPGDAWELPYLGMRYNLSARSRLYFWKEGALGSSSVFPPIQDHALIDALRTLRPRGAVRFVVMHGGLVLTKIQTGSWREEDWEPRYVGKINYQRWFTKENYS